MASAAARPITDYTRFISNVSRLRKPSAIRALQPLMRAPGMISLGGGLPNPSSFPIVGASITLRDGTQIPLGNIEEALQYSASPGLPELVQWLLDYQLYEHKPPAETGKNLKLILTTGSQDALSKAFELVVNPGDPLLVEAPTYSGSLAFLEPYGAKLVEVPTDEQGLNTDKLAALLDNWPSGIQKPRAIYTIPTGSNPTGATLPNERRQALYRIAQQHDLVILEDDPYWFLQLDGKEQQGGQGLRSLLSIDTDGRVLRFDSFSKVISAGLRLGTVCGPAALIDRLELHMQATSLHTSGLSQAALLALFKHWGKEGFQQHVNSVQSLYRERRDTFCSLANKHLKDLVRFSPPRAGMFCWMEVLGAHIQDTTALIKERAVDKKVLLLPGSSFYPGNKQSRHVRASFSVATGEQMEEALKRFGQLLEEEKRRA